MIKIKTCLVVTLENNIYFIAFIRVMSRIQSIAPPSGSLV